MKSAGVNNANLYEQTGGNPFYVTEVLANRNRELPSSIREAVISHTAKFSKGTKELLNTLSVMPTKVEIDLLSTLFEDVEEHLDHCIDRENFSDRKQLNIIQARAGQAGHTEFNPGDEENTAS